MGRILQIYLLVYILMLAVIFVLPFFSSESYSILRNTTSQLGGQNMPNAWIMNLVFVLLGISVMVSSWSYLQGFWIPKILIVVFGLALIGTAIYSHAPIEDSLPSDPFEDDMHSLFAKITGFSFTFFAVAMAFILKKRSQIALALSVAGLDTLLSATMFEIPEVTGVFQRLIFILSFGWLGYILIRHVELRSSTQN